VHRRVSRGHATSTACTHVLQHARTNQPEKLPWKLKNGHATDKLTDQNARPCTQTHPKAEPVPGAGAPNPPLGVDPKPAPPPKALPDAEAAGAPKAGAAADAPPPKVLADAPPKPALAPKALPDAEAAGAPKAGAAAPVLPPKALADAPPKPVLAPNALPDAEAAGAPKAGAPADAPPPKADGAIAVLPAAHIRHTYRTMPQGGSQEGGSQ
jgi:hypothetical protein